MMEQQNKDSTSGSMNKQSTKASDLSHVSRKKRKQISHRARHRLLSIRKDVDTFCRPILYHSSLRELTLVANERCGLWYAHPFMKQYTTCYFKSTDGHSGTWNFSFKRLNLVVIREAIKNGTGCAILDASASKELPDSLSRTVPVWAAVINRISARFRSDFGMPPISNWDGQLRTPKFSVSDEEHAKIEKLLDERVESLYESQAIVDPLWLATNLVKPLRPLWITPDHTELPATFRGNGSFNIVCISCSIRVRAQSAEHSEDFYYSSGAADDQESWARHLTASLFWDNHDIILDVPTSVDETDIAIDQLVQRKNQECRIGDKFGIENYYKIGETLIYLGSRRAGRPPECWDKFDAILNVTDTEYSYDLQHASLQYYLQLPVREGKRDRTELERWMAVGIAFCLYHARKHRHVLIHCAQGRDRSVAVAMATISIFCDLSYPVQWKNDFWNARLEYLFVDKTETEKSLYLTSGLSEFTVQRLLGRDGRDRLMAWVEQEFNMKIPVATKQSLRTTLLLLQQDHENSDPSRSTMQKLNRFFYGSEKIPE